MAKSQADIIKTSEIDLNGAAADAGDAAQASVQHGKDGSLTVGVQQFGFSGERRTVSFSKPSETEGPFMFVSVNGYSAQIPYDTPVEVPVEVLAALDTCVTTDYVRDERGNYNEKHRRRFPYATL